VKNAGYLSPAMEGNVQTKVAQEKKKEKRQETKRRLVDVGQEIRDDPRTQ